MCGCGDLKYARKNHNHSIYETQTAHDNDVADLQAQIDALTTAHDNDVAGLQAQIDALTTAHNNDVTNLQGQIDALQEQVDDLVDHKTPIGTITIWAREEYFSGQSTIPDKWLLCNGQTVLRADYPDLFAAISTTFGSTSSSDFKLPDLRSRVPVGRTPFGGYFNDVGETGGETTHTLTIGEMPMHRHKYKSSLGAYTDNLIWTDVSGASSRVRLGGAGGTEAQSLPFLEDTGGNGSHNNIQPYLTINYIIKAL